MNFLKGFLMAGLVAVAAAAQTDATAPPAGAKVLLMLRGVGVQIYACKDAGAGPAWTFVAPRATLFDHSTEVGRHGAGPVWTLKDGSWVKGQVIATRPAAADAVAWLLLKAAETHGPGLMAGVKYIRRSETVGGKARIAGCDAAHLGATDEVPYKAVYTFYAAAE